MSISTNHRSIIIRVIIFSALAIFFIIKQKEKPKNIEYDQKTLGWVLRITPGGGRNDRGSGTIEYKYLVDGEWKKGRYRTNAKSTNIFKAGKIVKGAYYYVKYDKEHPEYAKLIISDPIPRKEGQQIRDSLLKLNN